MNNLKKIGIVVAVIALVLVIAVVVMNNWGTWTKNLVNVAGGAVGIDNLGNAVLDGIESGASNIDANTLVGGTP